MPWVGKALRADDIRRAKAEGRHAAWLNTQLARAIGLMNELGIIVDTGHCGRQTTLDACALSKKPVVASHTAARGVFDCDRGKSDEEMRRLADTGGVIGLVTNPQFLGPGRDVDMWTWLDHVDYIVNLVGWQHAAIGTDWPMPLPKSALQKAHARFVEESGWPVSDATIFTNNLVGFDDYRDLPNITRGLVKKGYSDEQIKGILGENFLRVFQEVCG